mgnify:CR=1 FL=1
MKKWHDTNNEYTDDELLYCLTNIKNGIMFISGPTMCGKTAMLKRLQSKFEFEMNIITEEYLVNYILGSCSWSSVTQEEFYENTSEIILGIEDIDFLAGKEATQKEAGRVLNQLCDAGKKIIITGISLKRKIPFLIQMTRKNTVGFFVYM